MKNRFRAILISLFLFSITSLSAQEFQFVNNKDNGLSKEFLQKLIHTFHPDLFFETGTYDGQTALNAAQFFDKVVTVEIFQPLFEQVQPKFASHPHIESYLGNSPEVIEKRIRGFKGTVLFWLDAHFSGAGTGMSPSENRRSPKAITPIREELRAISDTQVDDCIILIDDIRGFGSRIDSQDFLGCWAYPTVQELKTALLKINPRFEIALLGDMLLAYDATKYQPRFSPTVEACTKTRLFDGSNLSRTELHEMGKKIQNSTPSEIAFIKKLQNMMANYKDAMFWNDVWCGLVQKGEGNIPQAEKLFQSAFNRMQSATSTEEAQKLFQVVRTTWQDL